MPQTLTLSISGSYSRYLFAPQKRFLNPLLKISFLGHFSTLNFRKKIFWFEKNQSLNRFIDLKISFFITSLHVLSTPITRCTYLKKIFWSKNIFLRCGHMVLGVLRTCKEVIENQILRSINPFKR